MKFTLEQARILSGLSQIEMASRLGITEKTYIQYEKYRRVFRMDQAFEFMKHVTVPFKDVIFFENQVRNFRSNDKEVI